MKKSILALSCLSLLSCALGPQVLEDHEFTNINSIHQLIGDHITLRGQEHTGRILSKGILAHNEQAKIPAENIKKYCNHLGGKIDKAPYNYEHRNDDRLNNDTELFGAYICRTDKNSFAVSISPGQPESFENDKYFSWVFVREITIDEYYDIAANANANANANQLELEKALAKQEKERLAAMKKENFDRLKNYSVGDQICSADNRVGYVEKLSGSRVKISLFGIANQRDIFSFPKALPSYGLFETPLPENLAVIEKNRNMMHWDDRRNWSYCGYIKMSS